MGPDGTPGQRRDDAGFFRAGSGARLPPPAHLIAAAMKAANNGWARLGFD
jgi:hypothetical protein